MGRSTEGTAARRRRKAEGMASPFARILAQLAVASAGIVSRAFVSAYSQAVHSESVVRWQRETSSAAGLLSRLHRADRDRVIQSYNQSED